MGRFLLLVQSEKIDGPLRTKFSKEKWKAAFNSNKDDEADQNLYDIGIMISDKCASIRSALKLTFSNEIDKTTKLRSFISMANHNICAVHQQTQEAFDQATETNDYFMAHEFSAIKLPLLNGVEFTPDEIVQSIVDGIQLPIIIILNESNVDGSPNFRAVAWENVNIDLNMGVIYSLVESLWENCLWHDFRLFKNKGINLFRPIHPAWQKQYAASYFRNDYLTLQFLTSAARILDKPESEHLLSKLNFVDVKAITKDKKTQKIQLQKLNQPSDIAKAMLAARLYASEPYYHELLNEPQKLLNGATLNQLILAWGIVSSAVRLLYNELNLYKAPDIIKPLSWFPKFAPTLKIDALIIAVRTGLSVDLKQARSIIDLFTYKGAAEQELWAQPLIPVNAKAVVPLFAAAISPNLRRLVDVWLKQLNVDLGRRGPAFEKYINQLFQESIAESEHMKNAKVFPNGLKFSPAAGRSEQIDTVFVFDGLVVLGESKCIRQPTEVKEAAMHRKTIESAVQQIKRKAASVENHRDDFRNQLKKENIELDENFEILPIIVLNSPIHSGWTVEDVPIVDEQILNVFFKGELIDFACFQPNGEMEILKKTIIYTSPTDARKNLVSFFRSPYQLKGFIEGVKSRLIPIPSTSGNDWSGFYISFECHPILEKEDIPAMDNQL